MTLFKYNGGVLPCADDVAEQARIDYNIPDAESVVITDDEWEEAGCLARIIDGEIFVGKTDAEKLFDAQDEVRAKRNRLLAQDVDPVQGKPLYWEELTEEERTAWKEYRQALLDVPEQEIFATAPEQVEWPEKPEAC